MNNTRQRIPLSAPYEAWAVRRPSGAWSTVSTRIMDELPEAYVVRQIHPESLAGSADSLFDFLSGWFGGPPLYSDKKGHPRLRMRHAPYAIGQR